MQASESPYRVLDTLGLSEASYQQLVDHFSHRPLPTMTHEPRRQAPRTRCDPQLIGLCQFQDEATKHGYFAFRPRDISQAGLGFLHGQSLPVHSRCLMTLIVSRQYALRVPGRIVHCERQEQSIYRVGIRFEERIDLAQIRMVSEESPTSA